METKKIMAIRKALKEADEILIEDLEAAAEMWDRLSLEQRARGFVLDN